MALFALDQAAEAWGQATEAEPTPEFSATADQGSSDSVDGLLSETDDLDQLLNLAEKDVAQLANVDVTAPSLSTVVSTVARQASTVGRSPAAVFVITQEMIRRSGARSIPEILRMAPGVQVARIDANKWAISARGLNGRFANKLLVQIDGRTVYTPLFAGVFWDVQDVLLEDIERIEVIRGPGATVWGANAVNGVINIITKRSDQTQGTFFEAGGGTERAFSSARQGGQLGPDATYRVYGKWFDRDEGFAPFNNAHDDWRMVRGGARIDWEPNIGDTVTLQGDYYNGFAGRRNLFPAATPPTFFQVVDDDDHVTGGNVLFRFTRELDEESNWSLQMYYDRTERHFVRGDFSENRDTVDFDFQHLFPVGWRHKVIYGFGYRFTHDVIRNQPSIIEFDPNRRGLNLFSAFIQDEIALREDSLYFTLGSKFQHNDFTGFEIQPTARLLWTPTERHSLWSSVSRAVRTPSRAEEDIRLRSLPLLAAPGMPLFPSLIGNPDMDSEVLLAYEIGIREQTTERFSWDLALFYHDYSRLLATVPGQPTVGPPDFLPQLPLFLTNRMQGETYGFELASNYQVTPNWKIFGSYSFLRIALHPRSGVAEGAESAEGESPRNQLYVQSSWDLKRGWEFDLMGRYVDSLPALNVPSYLTMDMRLAWHATPNLEFAVVGRHLLDRSQPEFGFETFTGNVATEVRREVFGMITWRR